MSCPNSNNYSQTSKSECFIKWYIVYIVIRDKRLDYLNIQIMSEDVWSGKGYKK